MTCSTRSSPPLLSSLQRLSLHLLRLLALAFLLTLLELPEPSRPRVPPLDHQTAFVCHHAALARGVLVVPQQQVLLARFDLGTLARHIFGPHPQELVAAANAALALLVDGDDVDGELPPLAGFVSLQDVHLDGWGGHRRHHVTKMAVGTVGSYAANVIKKLNTNKTSTFRQSQHVHSCTASPLSR